MKKTYVKPELVVESFQLDAANAASCSGDGLETINRVLGSCEHASGLFANGCTHEVSGDDRIYDTDDDEFCYHGPVVKISDSFLQS